MANVPAKSIKFPGLENTYTFLQNDATLTQAGRAADAKATGDAVNGLRSAMGSISGGTRNVNTAATGRYSVDQNTGVISETTSQNVYGISRPVEIEANTAYTMTFYGIASSNNRYAVYIAYYDSTGTYISGTTTSRTITDAKGIYTVTTPATAKFMAASIYAPDLVLSNENIQIEAGSISTAYVAPFTAVDDVARSDIETLLGGNITNIVVQNKPGYFNANGAIAAQDATRLEVYTNQINVKSLAKLRYKLSYPTTESMWLACAEYDENKIFVRRVTLVNSIDATSAEADLSWDDDVAYVAFTYRSYGTATFDVIATVSNAKMWENMDADAGVEIARNTNRSSIAANPLRFKPFYDHIFIDKINGNSVVIPSESLFNIRTSKRLGFDVIEANVQPTSDDNFIVMHGSGGKFGAQVEHIDGTTDISDIAINSVTLEWIKTNVRYKSIYAKYRVAPPSLQEYLYECRKNCMIPLATCSNATALGIIEAIMGKGNYIAYNGSRSMTDAIIMTYPSKTSKEEILDVCESFGVPYMYCMANPTSFTTNQLQEIVELLHDHGYWIGYAGSYLSENESQRLMSVGFDFCASGWQINDFESGNLCNLTADVDYSDFTTTGTVTDNLLTLETGQTIEPGVTLPTVFLGGGSLHIRFNGSLTINLGKYINSEFESDGSQTMWFSTYYLQRQPTFWIQATSTTTITSIEFKASKM